MGFEGCLLDLCHLYPLLFVVQTAALLEDRHDENPRAPSFKMYSRSHLWQMQNCYIWLLQGGGGPTGHNWSYNPYIFTGFIIGYLDLEPLKVEL